MGYDNTGKYILIVPDKPALLDSMTVNGKKVNAAVKRWVPGDGLKIKYIWKSGVSASGALPSDMNFLKQIREGKVCNVIYLGIRPGSIIVGPDGSVNTYNGFRETARFHFPLIFIFSYSPYLIYKRNTYTAECEPAPYVPEKYG